MIYTLKNTTDNVTVTPHLKGYWLYVGFTVDPATGWVTAGPGYAAFDYSVDSNMFKNRPPVAIPYDGQARSYDIADNTHTFQLFHAKAVRSYKAEYANEVRQLHLLVFDNMQNRSTWFADGGFDPAFEDPKKDAGGNPFLQRTLSYKNIQNRYVFSAHTEESNNGVSAVMLTLPFLKASVFSHILKVALDPNVPPADAIILPEMMPTLSVTTGMGKAWSYFDGNLPLKGAVNGFVMVSQGAFKEMELNNLYAKDWQINDGAFTHNNQTVLQELVKIAHNSTRFTRTTESVDITDDNAIHPGSKDGPVEILYLGDLNSKGQVEPLL